jgi:hypothetical protein
MARTPSRHTGKKVSRRTKRNETLTQIHARVASATQADIKAVESELWQCQADPPRGDAAIEFMIMINDVLRALKLEIIADGQRCSSLSICEGSFLLVRKGERGRSQGSRGFRIVEELIVDHAP